jgi:adenylate kinase family enzyme
MVMDTKTPFIFLIFGASGSGKSTLVSSQSYNVVKYISYVPHIQLEGIKHEEIHCDAY